VIGGLATHTDAHRLAGHFRVSALHLDLTSWNRPDFDGIALARHLDRDLLTVERGNRPHAPLAKFPDDLVNGVIGQPRGQRTGRRPWGGIRAIIENGQPGERRHERSRRARLALRITQPT
jgi:hypothetical protein